MKLYHMPGSRSLRCLWLLEELGIGCEIESLAFGDGSRDTPAYRALNPLGKVPTLVDGEVVLYESGAIVEYLLERYGEGRLAPPAGSPERGRFLQWIHWSEATLLPPLGEVIRQRFMLPEAERVPAVAEEARSRFRAALRVVEDELASHDYLVGGAFSAADVMLAYSLQLAKMVGELGDEVPRAAAYLERLSARPAFQKAASR